MITFGEAVEMLNEQHAHECGYHLSTLDITLFPKELAHSDTPHNLMKQTYDWRWYEPDKETYSVELSADDMRYIGYALEAYNKTMGELYIEPELKKLAESLGGKYGINQ